MMLARCPDDSMNALNTQLVASSTLAPGQVTVPMFSPASLKQYPYSCCRYQNTLRSVPLIVCEK